MVEGFLIKVVIRDANAKNLISQETLIHSVMFIQ